MLETLISWGIIKGVVTIWSISLLLTLIGLARETYRGKRTTAWPDAMRDWILSSGLTTFALVAFEAWSRNVISTGSFAFILIALLLLSQAPKEIATLVLMVTFPVSFPLALVWASDHLAVASVLMVLSWVVMLWAVRHDWFFRERG